MEHFHCHDKECPGILWSLWDAAARLASYSGYAHYKCDRCGSRYAVKFKR